MAYFDDTEIKNGLIQISEGAVKACAKEIHALLPRQQGLEKLFQTASLRRLLAYKGWSAQVNVPRSTLPYHKHRELGWVDAILSHGPSRYRLGIEFKVCMLPRLRSTSPKSATYDVEQLAWDYAALRTYKHKRGIECAYCVVLIHGVIPGMESATSRTIARLFHNAMFLDFEASRRWGKYSKMNETRLHEIEAIGRMGFDQPFNARAQNPNSFCRLFAKQELAVLGIHVA